MSYSSESFSCYSPKDYGELSEFDESSLIGGDAVEPTTIQRSQATERLSSSRYPSEMSMDLSELQIEEGSSSRLVNGSMLSNNSSSEEPPSPRGQHHIHRGKRISDLSELTEESYGKKTDDENEGSSGYFSYRSGSMGAKSGALNIPEDFFQQSTMSDFTSFYTDSFRQEIQRQSLTTVEEQGDTESDEASMGMNSLTNLGTSSRRNSLNSSVGSGNRRKVKFEISTRLEDIQEFEKPDIEDYHMLYYTSHELQKMIDGQREEERRERNTVR